MPIYFLDTSALQHRYVKGEHSRKIRKVVSTKQNECFIADWTVLEIASALARRGRQQKWQNDRYDALDQWFWSDVASSKLNVRPTGRREILRARDLIRYAGVVKRRKISSGDALIAVCCLALALERRSRVVFYLEDRKLYNVLNQIKAYTSALELRAIAVPKGKVIVKSDV